MKTPSLLSRILNGVPELIALSSFKSSNRKNRLSWNHTRTLYKTIGFGLIGMLLLGCPGDPIPGLVSLSVQPPSGFVTVGGILGYEADGVLNNQNGCGLGARGTSNGCDETGNVIWDIVAGSAVSNIATLNSNGGGGEYATGIGAGGPITVRASGNLGNNQGYIIATGLLTVSSTTLVSITIVPSNPYVPVGASVQFTATGTFADGSTADITNSVIWSSSDVNVASISTAATPNGSATGLAVGGGFATVVSGASPGENTTITASTCVSTGTGSFAGVCTQISANTVLTVSQASLASISITPATASLVVGTTQQFIAAGIYNDGSTYDITPIVSWSSADIHVATIIGSNSCTSVPNTSDSCGLATATGIGGPDTITASITVDGQTFTNTAQLSSATGATLTSIDVDPITPSVAAGSAQQFTAQGIFSDGSTHDVTSAVNWVSSNTAAGTINAQGLASVPVGAAAGSNTIIAASTQVSGQTISAIAILTVAGKTLVSVNVTPATASVAVNGTQQFTLTGTYSDSSTQNLTSSAAWSSSNPSVATVVSGNGCSATPNTSNSCGFATGVAAGGPVTITATITASGQTFNGSGQLSVTTSSPTLVSISVTPMSASVAVNGTQQFTATGTYSDNSTQNLTGSATWTSSDTSVATIVSGNGCSATPNTSNSCGFATGVTVGSPVTITASVMVSGQTFTSTTSLVVSVLACNPPPNPSGGGSLPYENESYCASFSGVTDMLYTFTGILTFTTPITPGSIINCEYATSGTWNSQPASTGPTSCTGGIDPYGNLSITDSLGNTFTGTFSSDGTSVSGSYLFTDFGPSGGVATGSFSGTEQQ